MLVDQARAVVVLARSEHLLQSLCYLIFDSPKPPLRAVPGSPHTRSMSPTEAWWRAAVVSPPIPNGTCVRAVWDNEGGDVMDWAFIFCLAHPHVYFSETLCHVAPFYYLCP